MMELLQVTIAAVYNAPINVMPRCIATQYIVPTNWSSPLL